MTTSVKTTIARNLARQNTKFATDELAAYDFINFDPRPSYWMTPVDCFVCNHPECQVCGALVYSQFHW